MDGFKLKDAIGLVNADSRAVVAIVDRDPAVANSAAQSLARNQSWMSKSVATDLAPILLETRPADRADRAIEWLDRETVAASPNPLILIGIDLLFEPSLAIDVIAILARAARRTPLLVAWPGTNDNGRLAYAAQGHAQAQSFQSSDVRVVRAIT